MNRLKRVISGTSAAVLSLSSLLTMGFTGVAHAAGQTCSWTGAGTDNKFSTVANWADCGGGTPLAGDILSINAASLSQAATIQNDLTGLSVAGIQYTGTNTANYTLAGNPITLTGNIVTAGVGTLKLGVDITLGANVTFSYSGQDYAGLSVDTTTYPNQVIDIANYNLDIDNLQFEPNKISGTGSLTVKNNGNIFWYFGSAGVWTGSLIVDSSGYVTIGKDSLPSTVSLVVNSGGALSLCSFNGASITNSLSVSGDGKTFGSGIVSGAIVGQSCGSGANGPQTFEAMQSFVWTGPITLTANTRVKPSGDFKVTGALSGNYTITLMDGVQGTLTIASSNNTSATQNGNQNSLVTNEYKDNAPTTDLNINGNEIGIVDGNYGNTNVAGVLKGTGTVKELNISVSGKLAPGHSPGCITATSLLLFGEYLYELGGSEPCTGYDQVKVTSGAVTIGSDAVLSTSRYNNYTPKQGDTFTVIDTQNAGETLTGTFKDLPEGATFEQNGVVFKITYKGGDGNDVVLTVQNQPTAPDTGFALLSANPLLTLGATAGAAAVLVAMARKTRLAHARVHARRRK